MTVPVHSHLTPAMLQALRDSLRPAARVTDHCGDIGVPYVTFLASDGAWAIHCYGRTMATSTDLYTVAAVLKNERAQPGWLRQVLDPTWDVRVEALNPWEASAERTRLGALRATQRAREAEEAEARRRRLSAVQTPIGDLELSDLFVLGRTPPPRS